VTFLPKFVRGRLAQGPGGGEHPEADLLNAFCEDALRPAEREQLLAHLAACAQCREVVALLTPAEGPPRPEVQPQRRWFSFPALRLPALRWAAITAAVTVVIAAALLYRPENPEQARSVAQGPASATSEATAKPPATEERAGAVQLPSPDTESKKGKKVEVASAQSRRQAALDTGARETASAASSYTSQSQAGRTVDKLGTGRAALPGNAFGPHANLQQQANQAAQVAAAPALPAAPLAKTAGIGAGATRAVRKAQADREAVQSAMAASAAPRAPGTVSQPAAPASAGTSGPPTDAAGADSSASRGVTGGVVGGAAGGVLGPPLAFLAKPVAVTWNISPDGQLLRKLPGEEPQTVWVANDVRFRAVASIRGEVWAGGPGGILYHSSDSGTTWMKVAFPSTQDITAISFRNRREGAITVAGGDRYATHDGGQSWQEEKKF